jgi:hypothetical protein
MKNANTSKLAAAIVLAKAIGTAIALGAQVGPE